VNFLRSGVENRVAFDCGTLLSSANRDKIALDSTAATDVRRAEFLLPLSEGVVGFGPAYFLLAVLRRILSRGC